MSNIHTLLIDTDIVAYKAAIRGQQSTCFGNVTDFKKACKDADEVIAGYAKSLKADRVIMCLSDGDFGGTSGSSKTEHNFRFGVLPSYKSNRKTVERPELLRDLKFYIKDEYASRGFPGCEADDVMGILATHPTLVEGTTTIVSEDKDLRTIPARVFAPHRSGLGVQVISELDANRFHCYQTVIGDVTDGYNGAPKVGPKSVYAAEILAADNDELWDLVWMAFSPVGLTETEAIQQARVARILRSEDYDLETKTVRLWTPELLLKEQWK